MQNARRKGIEHERPPLRVQEVSGRGQKSEHEKTRYEEAGLRGDAGQVGRGEE